MVLIWFWTAQIFSRFKKKLDYFSPCSYQWHLLLQQAKKEKKKEKKRKKRTLRTKNQTFSLFSMLYQFSAAGQEEMIKNRKLPVKLSLLMTKRQRYHFCILCLRFSSCLYLFFFTSYISFRLFCHLLQWNLNIFKLTEVAFFAIDWI